MNKIIFIIALLLAVNTMAQNNSTEWTLNEAKESGKCYVACENGKASYYINSKRVSLNECPLTLEGRRYRPFNCSYEEFAEFRQSKDYKDFQQHQDRLLNQLKNKKKK